MAQRLKRWESPRKEGRNSKGRGGSARQRQRRKQMQMLRQKLNTDHASSSDSPSNHPSHPQLISSEREAANCSFFF